jgi:hypothetical protein
METQEIEELKKELQETREQLYNVQADNDAAIDETIKESSLKNEAYGFIISQGLLDKFISYRIKKDKEPLEAALEHLLLTAESFGDWIADL